MGNFWIAPLMHSVSDMIVVCVFNKIVSCIEDYIAFKLVSVAFYL